MHTEDRRERTKKEKREQTFSTSLKDIHILLDTNGIEKIQGCGKECIQ